MDFLRLSINFINKLFYFDVFKGMDEDRQGKYCAGFAEAVCGDEAGMEDHFKKNPKTRAAINQFKREEMVRKVTRNYASVKADFDRLDRGELPLKEFVSRGDYNFWKKVMKQTEKCVKRGGEADVSDTISVINATTYRTASRQLTPSFGRKKARPLTRKNGP